MGLVLLTACEELRVLGVPIEMWGKNAADQLAADVRTFWTTLASDLRNRRRRGPRSSIRGAPNEA
jgi:hypothetical protein